jgi:hypothetical protein
MASKALNRIYQPHTVVIVTSMPSTVGFENYLGTFNWLKWQAPSRITITGQILKDATSRWYIAQIENPYSSQRWTFEDIICELFQHFVHGSSAQKALETYNCVQYMYKDRVQDYHLELELKSRLLIVEPDTYLFQTRFIDGLPLEIQETLMKCEHIMAEHNMIQEIVRAVYNIEESNDAFNHKYKEALKHQGTCNHNNVVSYLLWIVDQSL